MMTQALQSMEDVITALVHNTLGTDPARITLEVLDDGMRVTVPVRNYLTLDVVRLYELTGEKYEVIETAATGTIDFQDNPERAEREGRVPHTGQEILTTLNDYLKQQGQDTRVSQPTFREMVSRDPEQLELIPR